ncbi:MAG: hypothetical protein Q9204_004437 [Flavoplaca sp. TL-2023a]
MGEREAYAWFDTLSEQAILQEVDLEGVSCWRVLWVYIEEVQSNHPPPPPPPANKILSAKTEPPHVVSAPRTFPCQARPPRHSSFRIFGLLGTRDRDPNPTLRCALLSKLLHRPPRGPKIHRAVRQTADSQLT